MKHFYLFLGLILLSFISCDNEINPLQPQEDEACIRFDVIEEWPTKGTTTDGTSIKNQPLGVLAYNIDGTTVTDMSQCTPSLMYNTQVSVTDGSWTYDNVKKWPASGTVNFFAYTPYEATTGTGVAHFTLSSKTQMGYPSITYRMNDQSNNHRDLLVASAMNRTKEGGVVSFEFKHALARIHFSAKLKEGCTYPDVKITQVSIKKSSFKNVGTLTFSDTAGGFSWDNLSSDGISTDMLMSSGELSQKALSTDNYQFITKDGMGYLFLIPQTAALQLKVYYTFTDENGTAQSGISICELLSINFEAGKAYNCQFVLDPQPMEGGISGEYTELAALKNNNTGYILLGISPNGNDMGVKMRLKYDDAAAYTYPLAVMSGRDGQEVNEISRRFYFLGKHDESSNTYFQVGWDALFGRLDNATLPYNTTDVLLAEFHYLNQNEIAITYPSDDKKTVTAIYERGTYKKEISLSELFKAEVSSDLPISLFGSTMNANTGSADFKVDKPWHGTIYEVWISKGTEDILHLKPVQRKSDSTYGMYDVIGDDFYPCSNSSFFEAIEKTTEEGTGE